MNIIKKEVIDILVASVIKKKLYIYIWYKECKYHCLIFTSIMGLTI